MKVVEFRLGKGKIMMRRGYTGVGHYQQKQNCCIVIKHVHDVWNNALKEPLV